MADVGLAATAEDEWVEALLALHRDRDRARALGRNGRELAEQRLLRPGDRSSAGGGHAALPMSSDR